MSAPRPVRLATQGQRPGPRPGATVAGPLSDRCGRPVELVVVQTQGDASAEPLDRIGGDGVFVAAVREAVRTGAADVAVHSLKDLPIAADPDLVLAAVPPREDPRDALVRAGRAPAPRAARGLPRRDRLAPSRRRAACRSAPISTSSGSAATSTPGSVAVAAGDLDARRARPGGAVPARPARRASPRCSTRCPCCRRPARARSRSRCRDADARPARGRRGPRRRRHPRRRDRRAGPARRDRAPGATRPSARSRT